MSLNSSSARCSQWLVRVLHSRVESYTVVLKGETVRVKRFEAVLVGKSPSEYVQGHVKFHFKDQSKPDKAAAKFTDDTVWFLKKPSIDATAKHVWNGAPNKTLVILDHPSELQLVLPSKEQAKIPSFFIAPSMRLRDVLTMTTAGSNAVDVVLYLKLVGTTRTVQAGGKSVQVRTLTVQDDSGVEGELAVWANATTQFEGMEGSACLVLGLTVFIDLAVQDKSVQLTLRENAFVSFQNTPRLATVRFYCEQNEDMQLERVTSSRAMRCKRIGDVMSGHMGPCVAALDHSPLERNARKRRQEVSRGGFIELNTCLAVDAWKALLESVQGVEKVVLHPKGSKADQRNYGDHYQAHNFHVFSSAYPSVGMEFELSRHQHSKDTRGKSTITALFKIVGNRAKQLVAWRILRASVAGRELLPKYAEDFETHLRELVAEETFSATSSASVLCSASAKDAGAALPFETSRPCVAALDHSPLEWDPDVQRILIQDAQPPDHDAVATLVRLYGHTAARAGMDPGLEGAREHKRLSAEAVQALICNVERLRSHGFTWQYLLNFCQGVLKPQYHLTWNEWIKFLWATTELELTEPVHIKKVRRLETNPPDPA
jgi:hypothetical protein